MKNQKIIIRNISRRVGAEGTVHSTYRITDGASTISVLVSIKHSRVLGRVAYITPFYEGRSDNYYRDLPYGTVANLLSAVRKMVESGRSCYQVRYQVY